MLILLPLLNALVTVLDSDSYDIQEPFDLEDNDFQFNLSDTKKTVNDPSSNVSSIDNSIPSTNKYAPLNTNYTSENNKFTSSNNKYVTIDEKAIPFNVKFPKNTFRSIRYGKIKTNPENLETLIQHEMEDISPDLHSKIRKKIAKSNVDRTRYKDLFFIKKRIIQDGNRKIVSFDIKEKIIPKNEPNDAINRDLSLRIILAGILFLLAGLVFTTTMKMYQNVFKNNLFTYDGKKEQNKESL